VHTQLFSKVSTAFDTNTI